MSLSISNIMTVFSIISCIVTALLILRTVHDTRKQKKDIKNTATYMEKEMSDYDRIVMMTHALETERQRNRGVHFEDESVYLNRAKRIREHSPFFHWIK